MLRIEISGCSKEEYKEMRRRITERVCPIGRSVKCNDNCSKCWEGIIHYKESEAWKPKEGEQFYLVNAIGEVVFYTWCDDEYDNKYYDAGNCFRTEEEAIASELYKAYRR